MWKTVQPFVKHHKKKMEMCDDLCVFCQYNHDLKYQGHTDHNILSDCVLLLPKIYCNPTHILIAIGTVVQWPKFSNLKFSCKTVRFVLTVSPACRNSCLPLASFSQVLQGRWFEMIQRGSYFHRKYGFQQLNLQQKVWQTKLSLKKTAW